MHGFLSALLVICFFASLCNFDCTFCAGYIAVMIATWLIAITLDAKTPVITISHHSVRAFSSFTSFLRNLKIEKAFHLIIWVISYKVTLVHPSLTSNVVFVYDGVNNAHEQ